MVVEHLSYLQRYYGKGLNDTQISFYVQAFRRVDDNILGTAVNECLRSEKFFPTVKVLTGYVSEARISAWQKQKESEPRELPTPKVKDPEHIEEGFTLLKRVFRSNGDPPELRGPALVAEMRMMEKAWPGFGWAENATELEQFLEKKKPGRFVQFISRGHTDGEENDLSNVQCTIPSLAVFKGG